MKVGDLVSGRVMDCTGLVVEVDPARSMVLILWTTGSIQHAWMSIPSMEVINENR